MAYRDMVTHQLEEAKWVSHYSSHHQILLVGEGDFSFSLCLAVAFGSGSNIYATSKDSDGEVIKKYKNGESNMDTLRSKGATVLHGVDVKRMKYQTQLQNRKFDRIVFNFPHAGFYGKEDNMDMIRMHQDLLKHFFKNASQMLRANGEVHVSHKTTPPYDQWNLKDLASENSLVLIQPPVKFKIEDYPGYSHKRGNGKKCDDHFPLGECSTFKFEFCPAAYKNSNKFHARRLSESPFDSRHDLFSTPYLGAFSGYVEQPSISTKLGRDRPLDYNVVNYNADASSRVDYFGHPHRNISRNVNDLPSYAGQPSLLTNVVRDRPLDFNCSRNGSKTFVTADNVVDYNADVSPRVGCFGRPQTSISSCVNSFPRYAEYDIHSEASRSFNGCFNNDREMQGRVGNPAGYCFYNMAYAPRRIIDGNLYSVGKDSMSIARRMEIRRLLRDHGQ